MKRTSRGSRLVSSAARSPARSSTGPEVWRRLTPISLAMMCASVVLPRPGGPNSSTWSSASFLPLAAWMKISSWPRIFSWPTYSESVPGRSDCSMRSSSPEEGRAEISRSVSTLTRRSEGEQHSGGVRVDVAAEAYRAAADVLETRPLGAKRQVLEHIPADSRAVGPLVVLAAAFRDHGRGQVGLGAIAAELSVERKTLDRERADQHQAPRPRFRVGRVAGHVVLL